MDALVNPAVVVVTAGYLATLLTFEWEPIVRMPINYLKNVTIVMGTSYADATTVARDSETGASLSVAVDRSTQQTIVAPALTQVFKNLSQKPSRYI